MSLILKKLKEALKITWLPVIAASLCCFSSIVLVMLGLSTVSFAASLANLFYGSYKWIFRAGGVILLIISLILYFRSKGVCTFDQVKRRRNEIVNMILLSCIIAIIGYIIYLYIVVEYLGIWLGIWQ